MSLAFPRRRALASLAAGVLVTAVALTGCAAGTSAAPTPSASAHGFDQKTVDELNTIIDKAVAGANLPGAIVSISGPGVDYIRAAGVADTKTKEPMRADFVHRIGSVTKTFSVTALLRLVDEGKMGLDDPISKYVPGVAQGDVITLRQLAGMQSGLVDYTESEAFQAAFFADPRGPLTPQQLIDSIAGLPLLFQPGTEVSYSNTNTVLIGMAIEKATGKPLAEVIKTEVTEPLGLADTFLPKANEFPAPHAEGYTNQSADGSETAATDWNPSWAWASGAMISTLKDLRVWVPALAKGDLLTPETQKERLEMTPIWPDTPTAGYGLGIFNNNGWIGHNGSLPGFKTVSVYLPEKELTLIVMINTDIESEESSLVGSLMTPLTTLISPKNIYS